MDTKYDFGGWVTRNDILCTDGRTIRHGAFADNDGQVVPLVWNHCHNGAENVLGKVLLSNRDEGVYGYCQLNHTDAANTVRELIKHKDITALSINANKLKQSKTGDVLHGDIKEVSLVLAGANPGAYIDSVLLHSELGDDGTIIYNDEEIEIGGDFMISHSYESEEEKKKKEQEDDSSKKEEPKKDDDGGEETVQDILETLSPKQEEVFYALIDAALKDGANSQKKDGDKEEEKEMKHNVFDGESKASQNVLSHADQQDILKLAKTHNVGSFKQALEIFEEENNCTVLSHADVATASGFAQPATGVTGDVTTLFPEYKDVRPGAPELITYDQGWVDAVLNKVHKSPISRIRTRQVDIRNIKELQAKGYTKGKKKTIAGNFNLVTRETDPQTVYVKSALHRDDIIDITDFDYVQYLYNIDNLNLRETLALAIMLGDGREDGDEDKIQESHIRPIWTDDDLYTLHVDINTDETKTELQGTNTEANFGANFIQAESMVNAILYAREKYRGSGTPDLFITPHMLNVMLLARDMNGRRIYSSVAELASSLNVASIHTVEQFEGKERTTEDGATKSLIGIVCNLADYTVGATKGGELTHFTQFDINFNQMLSLLETRSSGALTRVASAIAIEETKN